jgi:hypothetical protein
MAAARPNPIAIVITASIAIAFDSPINHLDLDT